MSDYDQIESPNFREMDIGKLRQYASHLRLPLAKTATKVEIIEAIDSKLAGRVMPEIVSETSKVKPGYAKIRVLSDPMPGASNLPVFVSHNMYTCQIPRDVDVIVPLRVVRTLTDAMVKRKKQTLIADADGREVFRETEVATPSYPFMVLEMVPGPEQLTPYEIGKRREMGPRMRYRALFGRWPRARELTRAIEQNLVSLNDDESLGFDVDALKDSDKD